ncbi:UDP-glucose 4-epimerase [bacterium BMS3Abin04]|nr:UDP-glucose 4-epimerase [bacterium BMS3Abin04]
MKIMIFGNLGYVGASVVKQLRHSFPEADLIGYDIGYFAHCLTHPKLSPEVFLNKQIFADIRKVKLIDLEGIDAVVDLAAISNDPMGNKFEQITLDINYKAAIRLAQLSKQTGVKHFVYASSCSIYGAASEYPKKETDEINPLTAYAKSKVYTEKELEPMADTNFTVTCLRFATACGWSDRFRLDLVLNDFVASALANGEITILSDGTPWRPMINTKDMARAINWAILRKKSNGGEFLVVNAGSNGWNNQIKPLAEAVSELIPNIKIIVNSNAAPDKRSYRVNFDLFKKLAPDFQPIHNLESTIAEIKTSLIKMKFNDSNFRESDFIRLKVITDLLDQGLLNKNFEWQTV